MNALHHPLSEIAVSRKPKSNSFWAINGGSAVLGLFATMGIVLITMFLVRTENASYRDLFRAIAARDLAAIRGSAEIEINRRIHVLEGLRAFASINPDMTRQQFADLSANLMKFTDGIRSVTSIKNNIINDVYPLEGNEGAIGIDLLKQPDQRANVEYAIETGKPWLAGPVKLVQGGEAFIYRAPVYQTTPGEAPSAGDYWGMVSILIDKPTLNESIRENVPSNLKIAIRSHDFRDEPGQVFLGDESMLDDAPVQTTISLPTGSWRLYGMPQAGWPTRSPNTARIELVGFSIAAITGLLIFMIFRSTGKYRDQAHELAAANKEALKSKTSAQLAGQRAIERANKLELYSSQLEEAQLASMNMMDDIESARLQLESSNERIKKSNQELEQFAYVASHDLQEPLRKVSSFCQLLEEHLNDSLDDEARQYMDYIVDGATRMRTLTQDLLSYSQVQSAEIELKPTDVNESIADAIKNLQLAIDESAAKVTFDRMPVVMADHRQLVQMFQNLIGNGVKYRGEATPEIQIAAQDEDTQWVISVKDNGIGIAPNYHQRVFGIFKRLHARSEYEGTGIGLAICQRIAERLRGRIWLESEEGQGTTFFFSIPKVQGT